MTTPVFLSPALPSELLSYILDYHVYPTTLIICSSRADFLASIIEDIRQQSQEASSSHKGDSSHHHQDHHHHHDQEQKAPELRHTLLTSPLHQIATSRHIRVIYTPTVTHLRAALSIFSHSDSRVSVPPPPPKPPPPQTNININSNSGTKKKKEKEKKRPNLIIYGLLSLHRDTSEWSAQGLSNTASALVELSHRLSWGLVVVEPRLNDRSQGYRHTTTTTSFSSSSPLPSSPSSSPLPTTTKTTKTQLEDLLREVMPVLNGGARRLGPDAEDGAWSGRTVEAGRVLGRWFRFRRVNWEATNRDQGT